MRPRPATPNDELLNHLKSLEGTLRDIKVQVRHQNPMSPMKKIAIGLGLAFLSASTVRYWFDKIEPVAKAYVETHKPHDDSPVYVLDGSNIDVSSPDALEIDGSAICRSANHRSAIDGLSFSRSSFDGSYFDKRALGKSMLDGKSAVDVRYKVLDGKR